MIQVDLFVEFAELLHVAGGPAYERAGCRLRRSFATSADVAEELAAQFAAGPLQRAVEGFDLHRGRGRELHWLEQVFYRYSLSKQPLLKFSLVLAKVMP